MQNLITRSISALVYVALFLFAILFSPKTYMALIVVFAVICLWEFSRIIQFRNAIPYILLVVIAFFLKEYASNRTLLIVSILTIIASGRLLFHLFSVNKIYPNNFLDKLDLCIRYIITPFTFLMLLPFVNNGYSPNIIISIIVLIWVNDSFAYLVGRKFGKTKLFERVSPKKTIEGFIGGLVFAIISSVVLNRYLVTELSVINWIIIAIIVVVFGTLGDLVESKFKRQANVKDSGKIMPGHGGLLDRLDSLFFLAPFVYIYLHFLI